MSAFTDKRRRLDRAGRVVKGTTAPRPPDTQPRSGGSDTADRFPGPEPTRTPGRRGYAGRKGNVPGASPELPRAVTREHVADLLARQPSPPPDPPATPAQPREVRHEQVSTGRGATVGGLRPTASVLDREPVPAEGKSPGTPRHAPK